MDISLPLWGFGGGSAAVVLRLYGIRMELLQRNASMVSLGWTDYLIFFAVALIGSLLVLLYGQSGIQLNEILAFNVGASAPLGVAAALRVAPAAQKVEPPPED